MNMNLEIAETANKIARADGIVDGKARIAIAKAILAERKRCAELAQREADGYKSYGIPQGALGALQVRKAIISGEQP